MSIVEWRCEVGLYDKRSSPPKDEVDSDSTEMDDVS